MRNRCLTILLIKYAQFVGRHVNFIWLAEAFEDLELCELAWLQKIERADITRETRFWNYVKSHGCKVWLNLCKRKRLVLELCRLAWLQRREQLQALINIVLELCKITWLQR